MSVKKSIFLFFLFLAVINISKSSAFTLDHWWQSYFNHGGIYVSGAGHLGLDKVAADINSLQSGDKCYIAMLIFTNTTLLTAVNNAYSRGADIRLIVDDDNGAVINGDPTVLTNWSTYMQSLSIGANKWGGDAAVTKKSPDDDNLHHKFAFFEQNGSSWCWTGSANWTNDGFNSNSENYNRIADPDIANNYYKEFMMMWGAGPSSNGALCPGKFKTAKNYTSDPINNGPIKKENATIHNYFSPNDKWGNQTPNGTNKGLLNLDDLLNSAQESIYFSIYMMYDQLNFVTTIKSKDAANKIVNGIYDEWNARTSNFGYEAYDDFEKTRMDVRRDTESYNMHSKVFIIDQSTVTFGSYNFTSAAETANDENVLMIWNYAMAREYVKQINWRITHTGPDTTTSDSPAHDGTKPASINNVTASGASQSSLNVWWESSAAADFSRYYIFVASYPISTNNDIGDGIDNDGDGMIDEDLNGEDIDDDGDISDRNILLSKVVTVKASTFTVISKFNDNDTAIRNAVDYWIAVVAVDKSGNESNFSVTSVTGTIRAIADTKYPSIITNLSGTTGSDQGQVNLTWTAPYDDGTYGGACYNYIVRYSSRPLSEFSNDTTSWWDNANDVADEPEPALPRVTENFTVGGFSPGATCYFAIKVQDEQLNTSAIDLNMTLLSPVTTFACVGDIIPPDAISNLAATTGSNYKEINLTWTAPGDNLSVGNLLAYPLGGYLVKYATYSITTDELFNAASTYLNTWSPGARGTAESKTLTGLSPGATFYISIKAFDETPNYGTLSNTSGNSAMANKQSNHLVISEFKDNTPEFVELYNPTTYQINLDGWYIGYSAATNVNPSYATIVTISTTIARDGITTIPSNGFFLITATTTSNPNNTQYDATDGGLGFGDAGGFIGLKDPSNNIIDKIGYGTLTISTHSEGGVPALENLISTERKPGLSQSTNGNGWDTDVNGDDFELRTTTSGAQNRDSVTEPGPVLSVIKDSSGGMSSSQAGPNEIITYTITVNNTGQGAATGVILKDCIPQYTTFYFDAYGVGQGIRFDDNPKTNVSGDDAADYEGIGGTITVNIGTIAAASFSVIEFQCYVNDNQQPVSIYNGGDRTAANTVDTKNDAIVFYNQGAPIVPTTTTITVPQVYGIGEMETPEGQIDNAERTRYYVLTATNTGNLTDSFSLSVSTNEGEFWPTSIIQDTNQDGIHTAGELTAIISLVMSSDTWKSFFFKIVIPSTATHIQASTNTVRISASGQDTWSDADTRNIYIWTQCLDTINPQDVTDLAASLSNLEAAVKLTWTAPGDDGTNNNLASGQYAVRYTNISTETWSNALFSNTFSTSSVKWQVEYKNITGLTSGVTYYFWLQVTDDAGLTNTITGKTTAYAQWDIESPAAVDITATTLSTTSVRISWTAPGDSGNNGNITGGKYNIRYSSYTQIIIEGTWNSATYSILWDTDTIPGTSEFRIITGLSHDTTYYFNIKTADENIFWSSLGTGTGKKTSDEIPPGAVTDLAALPGINEGEIFLSWTMPGDNGQENNVTGGEYNVKYSTTASDTFSAMNYSVLMTTSFAAGQRSATSLTGLTSGVSYYFYVKIQDEAPNLSGISNKTTAYAQYPDVTAPAAINNLTALTGNSYKEITISWTAPGDDGTRYNLSGPPDGGYIVKYSTSSITNQALFDGASTYIQSWSPQISGTAETKTLTGLMPGVTYYIAIEAYDELRNTATLSNVTGNSAMANKWSDHLIISEYAVTGPTIYGLGAEFIELYNPTTYQINLTGYKLVYSPAGDNPPGWGTTLITLLAASCTVRDVLAIEAGGYFLVVSTPEYQPNNTVYDATDDSLGLSNSGAYIAIKNASGVILDYVGYGAVTYPQYAEGGSTAPANTSTQSVERFPGQSQITNGNGWDTDNNRNDFELRTTTTGAQNRISSSEPQPNIVVTKNVSPGTAGPNDILTYTITVNNTGLGSATNVIIKDCIPAYTTFYLDAYGAGTGLKLDSLAKTNAADADEADYEGIGGTVTINIGTLSGNSSKTIEFKCLVNDNQQPVSIYNGGDRNTANIVDTKNDAILFYSQGTPKIISSATVTVPQVFGISPVVTPSGLTDNSDRTLYYVLSATNTGNLQDSISIGISTKTGSVWPTSIIQDTNQDGIHTAGEITAITALVISSDAWKSFFFKLVIPSTATHIQASTNTVRISASGQDTWEDADLRNIDIWTQCLDTINPQDVTDLAASPSNLEAAVKLTWTAPGDDGTDNNLVSGQYQVRYTNISTETWSNALYSNTFSTSSVKWQVEYKNITGLTSGVTYYFWLRVTDDADLTNAITDKTTAYAQWDIEPPAAVDITATTLSTTSIRISWTAPGDSGNNGNITGGKYNIRYSSYTQIIIEGTWNSATYSILWDTDTIPGTSEFGIITGLSQDTTYYFNIKAADDNVLWSALGSGISKKTSDEIPPGAVTDLAALPGINEGEIFLSWTMPGDNGTENNVSGGEYNVKYSTTASDTFAGMNYSIQKTTSFAAGERSATSLTGLTSGVTYYFYIKTQDEVPNLSGISNQTTAYAQYPDITAPGQINNLAAATGDSYGKISISWTAPGDDGNSGNILPPPNGGYIVRYSTGSITDQALFNSASTYIQNWTAQFLGAPETYSLTGLMPGVTYYFAIEAYDEIHNTATLSNVTGNSAMANKWADHPVISEFAVTGPGGAEFIELFNPTTGEINLSGYKIMYGAASSTPPWTNTLITIDATNSRDGVTTIDSRSYFLITSTGIYQPNNVIYDASDGTLGLTNTGGYIELRNASADTLDVAGYGTLTTHYAEGDNPAPVTTTTSIERKPGESQSANGNGWDSDNNGNDFEVRSSTTEAQNRDSGAEPKIYGLAVLPQPANRSDNADRILYYVYYASNTGNNPDTVTVSTSYVSGQYWSTAIIEDTNQNGTRDSGENTGINSLSLNPNQFKYFFLKITIPANATNSQNSVNRVTASCSVIDSFGDPDTRTDDVLTTCADNILPASLTDLSATQGSTEGAVKLIWTSSGDDGTSNNIISGSYVSKYTYISSDTWDSAMYSVTWATSTLPGRIELKEITGLSPGVTYYFYLKARDEVPNESALSNKTTSYAQWDIFSPAAVNLYMLSCTSITANPGWVSPGDDGVSENLSGSSFYEIRWTTNSVIDNDTKWLAAEYRLIVPTNTSPGLAENKIITGLISDLTYYFSIKTTDDVGNNASIGTGISTKTIDSIPPALVTDFSAGTGTFEGEMNLQWTNPYENLTYGAQISGQFIIKYTKNPANDWTASPYSLTIATTVNRGIISAKVISGLTPGDTYYFFIRVYDEVNLESELSNRATSYSQPYDNVPPAAIPSLAALPGDNYGELKLSWAAPGDSDYTGNLQAPPNGGYVLKIATYSVSTEQDFQASTTFYQTWAPAPSGNPEVKTFTGLAPGASYWFLIKAFDENGNISGVSNAGVGYANKWVNHLVISEFSVTGPVVYGSGEEFIELFNPTTYQMDLAGYKLVFDAPASNPVTFSQTLVTISTLNTRNSQTIILPKSYFLIVSTADYQPNSILYDCNAARDSMLTNSGGYIGLKNPSGTIIDYVGYGTLTVPSNAEGGIPASSSSISTDRLPGQSQENNGNGWDTDVNGNDFVVRSSTTGAQNRESAPEPNADMAITKTVNYSTLTPGATVTYTIRYYNTSGSNKTGVVIKDKLHSTGIFLPDYYASAQGIRIDTGSGWVNQTNVSDGDMANYDSGTKVVTVNAGTVNANTSGKIEFTVIVP